MANRPMHSPPHHLPAAGPRPYERQSDFYGRHSPSLSSLRPEALHIWIRHAVPATAAQSCAASPSECSHARHPACGTARMLACYLARNLAPARISVRCVGNGTRPRLKPPHYDCGSGPLRTSTICEAVTRIDEIVGTRGIDPPSSARGFRGQPGSARSTELPGRDSTISLRLASSQARWCWAGGRHSPGRRAR